MKARDLEYRMYGLVPYNISPIQQGIQFAHALQEYNNQIQPKPNVTYPKEVGDTIEAFKRWAGIDKTVIILNGGTTNDNVDSDFFGSLNAAQADLAQHGVITANFKEPDLGDQLTAVVFLVDERVFNKEKYPDYVQYSEFFIPGQSDVHYENWVQSVGGAKNVFLREFLKSFRLA